MFLLCEKYYIHSDSVLKKKKPTKNKKFNIKKHSGGENIFMNTVKIKFEFN